MAFLKKLFGSSGPTLSNSTVEASELSSRRTFHHGLPGKITVVAVDPIQSLLAVGCEDGTIKVFGSPNIEQFLPRCPNSPVRHLSFIVNEGIMVGVYDNAVVVWDLSQPLLVPIVMDASLDRRITALHCSPGSTWSFCGCADGSLRVLDAARRCWSLYSVPAGGFNPEGAGESGPITALALHPLDPNLILVGGAGGLLVLWNCQEKKAERRYAATSTVTALSWHREAKMFVSGHEDGSVLRWVVKTEKKPVAGFDGVGRAAGDGSVAIRKLHWSVPTKADQSTLYIAAPGVSGLFVWRDFERVGGSDALLVPCGAAADFQAVVSQFWTAEPETVAAIVVANTDGHLSVHNGADPRSAPLPLPGLMLFASSRPTAVCASECDMRQPHPGFAGVLYRQMNSRRGDAERGADVWPFVGGQGADVTIGVGSESILLTGHADGVVRLWDVTTMDITLFHELRLAEHVSQPLLSTVVTHIAFYQTSRDLLVACQSGEVLLFRFSTVEHMTQLVTSACPSPAGAPAAPPTGLATTEPRKRAPGYYAAWEGRTPVAGAVAAMAASEAWELVCVSWESGEIATFDTRSGHILWGCPPGVMQATALAFYNAPDDRVSPRKDDKSPFHFVPALGIGKADGVVVMLRVGDFSVISNFPEEKDKPGFRIHSMWMVDGTGRPVPPPVRDHPTETPVPSEALPVPPAPASAPATIPAPSDPAPAPATQRSSPRPLPPVPPSAHASEHPPQGDAPAPGGDAAGGAHHHHHHSHHSHHPHLTVDVSGAPLHQQHRPEHQTASPHALPPAPHPLPPTPGEASQTPPPVTLPSPAVPTSPVPSPRPAPSPTASALSPASSAPVTPASPSKPAWSVQPFACPDARYLVICHERGARVVMPPRCETLGRLDMQEDIVLSADMVETGGKPFLRVVTSGQAALLLGLPGLAKQPFRVALDVTGLDLPLAASAGLKDGQMLCLGSAGELVTTSMFRDEQALGPPLCLPVCYREGYQTPPRPKGGFLKGLFSSEPVDHDELFGREGDGPPDGAPAPASGSASGAALDGELREFSKPSARAPMTGVTDRQADILARAHRKAEDIRNTMDENRQKLNERGEKISKLDERTSAMEKEAGDFLKNIRELNRREAEKKWWQL